MWPNSCASTCVVVSNGPSTMARLVTNFVVVAPVVRIARPLGKRATCASRSMAAPFAGGADNVLLNRLSASGKRGADRLEALRRIELSATGGRSQPGLIIRSDDAQDGLPVKHGRQTRL